MMMMMRSVPSPMYMAGYYPGVARLNAPPPVCTRTYSVFLSSAGSSVASS
jgi:hypothetical protein